MARFTDEELTNIKQEISLIRIMEAQGHKLTKHGKDYVCTCPFHDDKTPSLIITPKTNLWHCMGACQVGGSVIDWVMKTQGVSFRYAVEVLKKDHIDLAANTPKKTCGNMSNVKYNTARQLPSSLAADLLVANTSNALNPVADHYHSTLLEASDALDYLEKRGLNNADLINTFKLGYANRTLAYHIPPSNRDDGAAIRSLLKEFGVLRNSGHEHLNGSITVPIFDVKGNVVEMYGRKIRNNLTAGTAYHLYLPGPHAGIWNLDGLKNQTEIILCESLIDAMTFWVHGFKNVTTSYGTAGFTDEHLQTFKTLGVERVLIAYDRDGAGNHAAEQLSMALRKDNIESFRILFPKGMDANEYALNMKPSGKALEMVIRKAEWLCVGDTKLCVAPERNLKALEAEKPQEAQITPEKNEKSSSTKTKTAAKGKKFESLEYSGIDTLIEDAEQTASLLAADVDALEITQETPPEDSSLPATPSPSSMTPDIPCKISDHEIMLDVGGRGYRVRGFSKNTVYDHLKISLMVCNENGFHTDNLDLYNAKARIIFINQACIELGVKDEVIKKDLGKVLLKLEELQTKQIQESLDNTPKEKQLTNEEKTAALKLLQSPDLMERILSDFDKAGVVGEKTNKLVGYLACTSRKLPKPLAVVVQSSSAAGKSSLMDAVLNFMPEEERIEYSAMTGQSLFYMGETHLKHKILAIAEEEGASNASYALKLLQSEGEVKIASTGKDTTTGNLITQEYRVEGPTQLFMTTTAIDIDEELMNRCLILSVDESREQTAAIQEQQRFDETLDGLFAKADKTDIVETHRNAQRLLKPYDIVNPYAKQLKFIADKTRTRRDHVKYLTLIRAITFLHQYQREAKTEERDGKTKTYIEVTLDDIAQANKLAHEVLGRTLDELPPQTRKLLTLIESMVSEQCNARSMARSDYRFSRKEIREYTQLGNTQLKMHCKRLEDMEYLLVHRGGRGQSFDYELLYNREGQQGETFLMGLVDVAKFNYDEKKSGDNAKKSAPGRGQVAPKSAGSRGSKKPPQSNNNGGLDENELETLQNAHLASENIYTSHRNDDAYLLAASINTPPEMEV